MHPPQVAESSGVSAKTLVEEECFLKDGLCPRCHARQVYSSVNLRNKSGVYYSNTIPLSFFRSIPLDNYVYCGYVESYVPDPEMLSRIKDIWNKVEPNQENPQ